MFTIVGAMAELESSLISERVTAGMRAARSARQTPRPIGDRPEGAALLALLQPGDVVITPKLDRMFRSTLDALDVLGKLKQAGIALHMIDLGGDTTGNGVSKLVFTILSAPSPRPSATGPASESPR
jgi:DNA invertase Pin-like site-specific DNA recombinase